MHFVETNLALVGDSQSLMVSVSLFPKTEGKQPSNRIYSQILSTFIYFFSSPFPPTHGLLVP